MIFFPINFTFVFTRMQQRNFLPFHRYQRSHTSIYTFFFYFGNVSLAHRGHLFVFICSTWLDKKKIIYK